MIKGSIQEEDITIINMYVPNVGAPQYIRQMITAVKEEINSNNNSGGLKHLTYTNGQIILTEN